MKIKKHPFLFVLLLTVASLIFSGCSGGQSLTPTVTIPAGATTLPPVFSPTVSPIPLIPTSNLDEAIAAGEKIAADFIRNSSTFKFDGIEGSLALSHSDPSPISAYRAWSYTFKFQTAHPGHGDRTGQILAEVITAHSATVMVKLDGNLQVKLAVCDDEWDMINDRALPEYISGTVINGGDTTQPGGPQDAPRKFVYQVMTVKGLVNVSYTAYPPSPAGDAAVAKIKLDFYNGEINTGDFLTARGTLDEETNALVVAEEGDYIQTHPRKALVVGVVVSIQATADGSTVYELLRDDNTFVNIRYTAGKGAARSFISDTVWVGSYMKAEGMYDRSTNTVMVAGEGDMIKTYDHNPLLAPIAPASSPDSAPLDKIPASLSQARPYQVISEGSIANEDKQRTAGLWFIISEEANSFEEYAQTAIRATLDLHRQYGKVYTSVILVPRPDVKTAYAEASFAADGKGAAGMTGSAPAVPMFWRVRAMDDIPYSEQELAVLALREEKQSDFPSRVLWSSLGYDEQALRQYIADTLNIPFKDTQPRQLKMAYYVIQSVP